MKIYISCNGLGLGHVGRTLVLAKFLRNRGDKVIFGTWGPAVEFSRKEGFPCYELNAVDWKDKEDGSFDMWGTVVKAPLIFLKMFLLINEERKILSKEKPNVIISDGSLAHIAGKMLGIPALYVNHQMDFPLKNKIVRIIAKKVHDCSLGMSKKVAVVDFRPPENTYPYSVTGIKKVVYTGPLVGSAPDDYETQDDIKKKLDISGKLCFIVISGPKHSPFALEKKIIELEPELIKMKDWTFIIKVPNKHEDKQNIRYLKWIDEVYELIKASDVIVSRAGYTTVCDILVFSKKSILIPQPKQVEQETLSEYLKYKGIAETVKQDKLENLPQLIEDTFDDGIEKDKIRIVSSKINEASAKEKIVDIIDEIAK